MKLNHNYSNRFRILKGGKISLVVSALLGSVSLSFAAPSGGVVTSGTATISQSGNTTNINQSTQKASINWQKFGIKADEVVNFNQPNVNSITLNRVIGNERSIIDGALNANGQVWILNSNGVLFGKNASINTAGLLATTKNISDTNFQAGNYTFTGNSTESIINQGTIKVKNNGYVIFASNEVRNSGTIEAVKGRVQLTGADEYTINLNGNSLIDLSVDKGTLDALVENSSTILADGGEVYLTTHAVDELLRGVVNNTGIIEANSLDGINGHVELYAHGGTANIAGTIKAKGGFVETSGKELNVASTTSIETSKWLLDPVNMTIESTGGTDLSGASVSATAIQSALVSADVELQADQDITVNENITWGDTTKLTLTAGDEIYVNATIENTNATNGGVYFNAANNSSKVIFNTNGKVIINNVNQLQWMNTALNGNYELGSNIDASITSTWNSDGSGGYYGFKQIGDSTFFIGNFDGKGYVIDGLYINRGSENVVGLFGFVSYTTIYNLGLTNAYISGSQKVGGIMGHSFSGNLNNVFFSGTINSNNDVIGGLIGKSSLNLNIINSFSTGKVSGNSIVGGLIGRLSEIGANVLIEKSYSDMEIIGTGNEIGGLAGSNGSGDSLNIKNSYFSGSVKGNNYVGGILGKGLIVNVNNVYVSGRIEGNSNTAALNSGTTLSITNFFWDTETTGVSTALNGGSSTGITGINSTNSFNEATYAGFDFTNDWIIYEGHTRPLLRAFMTELTVKANDVTRTYDGTTFTPSSTGVTYSIPTYDSSLVQGSLNYTSSDDLKNAGTATIGVDGLYSSQQGYIINYGTGNLTTNKRTLTLEAKKDYDGTTDLTGFVTLGNLVGAETLDYTGAKANSSNPTAENFIKEITLQDGTNGGVVSNYELPSLLAYSANNSVQIGDIPIEPTTTPDLSKVITPIANKTVLTNKDIDTLLKSGIDIKTILQQLDTNELALIPGIVMQVLNGGINLPFGSKQQFSLNQENEDNEKNNAI